MSETIEINGATYNIMHTADKITLQRYNEKYKMWVNLHFPKDSETKKEKIEENIIQILSNQYIRRNVLLYHRTE